ncbi:hypothetical protein HY389_01865 [Candidatus Daviesbacteria bacterium]|nr:hypothetical protein [Candidatus Daviesbacteria bacterium]
MSLLAVAFTTLFFSFIIQAMFLFYYKITDSATAREYKNVFDYMSGIFGDGILVPITNVAIVQALNFIPKAYFDIITWLYAIALGFGVVVVAHWIQKQFSLTNWTMPQVGKWNSLGFYHAIFMFFESTFLSYALIVYVKRLIHFGPSVVIDSPIKFAILSMVLFFVSFAYDYWQPLFKGLFLGKIYAILRAFTD